MNEHSVALAREWRRLGRIATVVAIVTSPALFVALYDRAEWPLAWALVGTLIGVALFASASTFWIVLLGAAMAILPDPLQFLYGRFPREPLRSLQRFHVLIHTERRLEGRPVFGLTTQLTFVILFVAFSLALHRMDASTG